MDAKKPVIQFLFCLFLCNLGIHAHGQIGVKAFSNFNFLNLSFIPESYTPYGDNYFIVLKPSFAVFYADSSRQFYLEAEYILPGAKDYHASESSVVRYDGYSFRLSMYFAKPLNNSGFSWHSGLSLKYYSQDSESFGFLDKRIVHIDGINLYYLMGVSYSFSKALNAEMYFPIPIIGLKWEDGFYDPQDPLREAIEYSEWDSTYLKDWRFRLGVSYLF